MNAERYLNDHRYLPAAAPCPRAAAGHGADRVHPPTRIHASTAHERRRSWNVSHSIMNAEKSEQKPFLIARGRVGAASSGHSA